MEIYQAHEQFELEVLGRMQSVRLLGQLIFGGGTMLRLCHELKRYSADLDFYLQQQVQSAPMLKKLTRLFTQYYSIKDAQDKHHTILVEIAAAEYPRRLKIEINKDRTVPSTSLSIAWSPNSTQQVPVTTIPIKQMMIFKIEALLDRKEIRDAYDIEFLIRRGIILTAADDVMVRILKIVNAFKTQDFKVRLGSILPAQERTYYRENRFDFLTGHLNNQLAQPKK